MSEPLVDNLRLIITIQSVEIAQLKEEIKDQDALIHDLLEKARKATKNEP